MLATSSSGWSSSSHPFNVSWSATWPTWMAASWRSSRWRSTMAWKPSLRAVWKKRYGNDLHDENDVNAFPGHWKNQLWGSWQDDASAGARVKDQNGLLRWLSWKHLLNPITNRVPRSYTMSLQSGLAWSNFRSCEGFDFLSMIAITIKIFAVFFITFDPQLKEAPSGCSLQFLRRKCFPIRPDGYADLCAGG